MKKLYLSLVLALPAVLVSFGCKDTTVKGINEDTKTFLTEMADARMMDREEGKQALAKGTTEEIRNYGALMVKDQTYLLGQLEEFAKTKKITLPTSLTDKKQKALDNLKEKTGKDLNKKFLNMICIDHKRDVRKFTKAAKSEDKDVSEFASKHLPMIESHLSKVEIIKKNYK